jgi:hypothetical protein
MPQGTAFGMGAHCWLPLRDWRAGVRHCLRRAAASVSERHPFFLLRAERGLAGPSPIRFSPALWAQATNACPERVTNACFAGSFT